MTKSALAATGIAFISSNTVNAFVNDCPFEGYNPFAEEKTDLRTTIFGNHVTVRGVIYDSSGSTPLKNADIEVWHRSPNSFKFRNRGKLKTNHSGEYKFITDVPGRNEKSSPRIYFKVSHHGKIVFTEILMNVHGVFITSDHYNSQSVLGSNLLPTSTKSNGNSKIKFNISI
jgi:protocatechuate 3,4-dioxygenase beta subunit